MIRTLAGIAWFALVSLPALAQHHGYAGMKDREIKALSPEQDRTGKVEEGVLAKHVRDAAQRHKGHH